MPADGAFLCVCKCAPVCDYVCVNVHLCVTVCKCLPVRCVCVFGPGPGAVTPALVSSEHVRRVGGGWVRWALVGTLLYTATCRAKPTWSLRPCWRATCKQTSRDVEAESTVTVRFSPVTKLMWIGMCFLDLTAWGQMITQPLPRGPPGLSCWPTASRTWLPEPAHSLPVPKVLATRCWQLCQWAH